MRRAVGVSHVRSEGNSVSLGFYLLSLASGSFIFYLPGEPPPTDSLSALADLMDNIYISSPEPNESNEVSRHFPCFLI